MKVIDIFTDRSLKPAKLSRFNQRNGNDPAIEEASMRAAFVIQQDESLFFYAKIKNWPSSTRAELAAIFLAFLIVPEDAQVIIHTDSQGAIQSLQQFQQSSARK